MQRKHCGVRPRRIRPCASYESRRHWAAAARRWPAGEGRAAGVCGTGRRRAAHLRGHVPAERGAADDKAGRARDGLGHLVQRRHLQVQRLHAHAWPRRGAPSARRGRARPPWQSPAVSRGAPLPLVNNGSAPSALRWLTPHLVAAAHVAMRTLVKDGVHVTLVLRGPARTGLGDAAADGLRERGGVAVRAGVQHRHDAALGRRDLRLRPLPAPRRAL